MKKVDLTIHAGHNAPHKCGAGAVGYHDESEKTREILKEVKKLLKKEKITFVDITVNHGKNASDVLNRLAKKQNKCDAKINISLHLNCFNKKAKGTEVLYKNKVPKADTYFKEMKMFTRRGVSRCNDLYIMNHFNSPTFLLELYFCDNKSDCIKAEKNRKMIAKAVVTFIKKNL